MGILDQGRRSLKQGRLSVFIALASCVFLLVVSSIFTHHNGVTNVHSASEDNAAVPLAVFKRQDTTPNVKLATPFGINTTHQFSQPNGNLRSLRSRRSPFAKRDVTLSWAAAVANGQTQLARLGGTRTESQWLLLSDIQSPEGTPAGTGKGWSVSEDASTQVLDGFEDAFEELDIPAGSANHYRIALQDQSFQNCRYTDLAPTGGKFKSYINVKGKTIVADVSWSPAAMVNEKDDPAPADWKQKLSTVSRMSDVTWIQWAAVAAAEGTPSAVSDLKYFFRHDIITENTMFIMEQSANVAQGAFNTEWPGLKYVPTDERFQALLGTVHGVSIVDLLVSHPNELGTKSIEAVNIFTTDIGSQYHMMWTLTGDGNAPAAS